MPYGSQASACLARCTYHAQRHSGQTMRPAGSRNRQPIAWSVRSVILSEIEPWTTATPPQLQHALRS